MISVNVNRILYFHTQQPTGKDCWGACGEAASMIPFLRSMLGRAQDEPKGSTKWQRLGGHQLEGPMGITESSKEVDFCIIIDVHHNWCEVCEEIGAPTLAATGRESPLCVVEWGCPIGTQTGKSYPHMQIMPKFSQMPRPQTQGVSNVSESPKTHQS